MSSIPYLFFAYKDRWLYDNYNDAVNRWDTYDAQKALLKNEILKKYRLVAESERKRNSELTILTADMVTCPFVDDAYKQSLLTLIGITEKIDQQMIMRFAKKQKYIFTRWTMFNLTKELQAKISQEVYS